MKTTDKTLCVAILAVGLVIGGCAKKRSASSWSLDKAEASGQLKQFVAAQETQARTLAKKDGKKLPSDFDAFYQAAGKGDWQDATNLFAQMSKRVQNDSNLRGSWWSAQNALADSTYLDYLHAMYGDKIYIPTAEDSQKCFRDYMEDAQKRKQNNQLKPGEDVSTDSKGKIQVSGQVAMEINGLLVKPFSTGTPIVSFMSKKVFRSTGCIRIWSRMI